MFGNARRKREKTDERCDSTQLNLPSAEPNSPPRRRKTQEHSFPVFIVIFVNKRHHSKQFFGILFTDSGI